MSRNQPVSPPSSFHHHWTNQISNTRIFLSYLMFKQGPNSEANRKRQEWRPADRICCLCRGTLRTWMPMPPCSTGKPCCLQKDAWATIAQRGSSAAISSTASAELGFVEEKGNGNREVWLSLQKRVMVIYWQWATRGSKGAKNCTKWHKILSH
jgi:hypothetical protein